MTERAPREGEADASADRIATGLHKIGLVLRHGAWQELPRSGLTPTQSQLLVLVGASSSGRTLSELAAELGVTLPTASDSLTSLARKGLVEKRRTRGDGRSLAVVATPAGLQHARRLALWPEFLLSALAELDGDERAAFQRGLVKMIRSLQVQGRIPLARMCANCRFFRPHVHADEWNPHHCAYVDAPFGDAELRIDCADHAPLPPDEADALWREFADTRSPAREETR